MKTLVQRIIREVEPVYRGSTIYVKTIWSHVLRVSGFAKEFAEKTGANQFVAEVGGLLHDIGGAMHGPEDHHITGAREATVVLLRCECPLELIGPIADTIYSYRGSQKVALKTPEAKCVAAADAKDHFTALQELWNVQTRDLGVLPILVYQTVSSKLERDWEKIIPEIRIMLDGTYEAAKKKLLSIASRNGGTDSKKR